MKIQLYKCSAHSYRFIILPVPKAEYTYCVQAALLKTISYKILLTAAQTSVLLSVTRDYSRAVVPRRRYSAPGAWAYYKGLGTSCVFG